MIPDDNYLEIVAYLNDELTKSEIDSLVERIKQEPSLAAELLAIAEDEVRIVEWARLRQQEDCAVVGTPYRKSEWRSIWSLAFVLAASLAIVTATGLAIYTSATRNSARNDTTVTNSSSDQSAEEFANGGDSRQQNRSGSTGQLLNKESYFLSVTQQVIARVVSVSSDIKWAERHRPSDFLMRFRPGDIVGIETGRAQIEFSSGAILVLNSPSVLQVTSTTSARLLNGTLVGRADRGIDFTIVTPSATVVDVGTEFGVGVGEAGTDVNVFDGEVHVHGLWSTEAVSSSVRQLEAGMSVRVDPEGYLQSLPSQSANQLRMGRDLLNAPAPGRDASVISLLDLIAGKSYSQQVVAGSIDASTGFWGRPSGYDPEHWNKTVEGGDKQFVQTSWNTMVDGVFIPAANSEMMQVDSDGHTIRLPSTTGASWGPIWSRRRLELGRAKSVISEGENDYWGYGSLEAVSERLERSRDGLLGLHANVGITFDLQAIRNSLTSNATVLRFKGLLANLDNSEQQDSSRLASKVDVRIFVDGKLRLSQLDLRRSDGEINVSLPFGNEDRFLTIVSTDADGSIDYDHAVVIDPVLEIEQATTDAL